MRNSDLIYVLGRGSLLESGNHAQLFLGSRRQKMFFGENSQTLWRWNTCVVMKPGFSLFRENLKKQTNFPGDVLWLASFLQLPPQSGRMSKFLAGSWERLVVEILRMHTYTETLTWCTKWTADVSQKQKALNNGTKVSHGLFTSWSWYCKVLL